MLKRLCGSVLLLSAAVGPFFATVTADKPAGERRSLRVRFVGGEKKAPLADVEVTITNGYGSSQQKSGPFRLDETGTCHVKLAAGFYSLHLKSKKEWPYLAVEELWNQRSRASRPDLSLNITDAGVEKWLDGKRRDEGFEAATEPGGAPRVTYTLLPACELVLSAVDADTGQGLAGAKFYTENAVGEDWAHEIDGENLGATRPHGILADDDKNYLTDKDGRFKRLVGANAGFKYGVESPPTGYELVEPRAELEVDVTYGQSRAEQVFKFRRSR